VSCPHLVVDHEEVGAEVARPAYGREVPALATVADARPLARLAPALKDTLHRPALAAADGRSASRGGVKLVKRPVRVEDDVGQAPDLEHWGERHAKQREGIRSPAKDCWIDAGLDGRDWQMDRVAPVERPAVVVVNVVEAEARAEHAKVSLWTTEGRRHLPAGKHPWWARLSASQVPSRLLSMSIRTARVVQVTPPFEPFAMPEATLPA
jgi:hypothetical protein